MAVFLLPWSSFVYNVDVYAADSLNNKDKIEKKINRDVTNEAENDVDDIITLQEDIEVNEDYILSSGCLDLNGYTVTVNGNFLHEGGKLFLNGGNLIINGDYRIQKYEGENIDEITGESEKVYSAADSVIEMNNENDYIFISNDFVVDNTGDTTDLITNGEIEAKGNVIIDNTNGLKGFMPSDSFVFLLSGEEKQTVEFIGDYIKKSSHLHNLSVNRKGKGTKENIIENGRIITSYDELGNPTHYSYDTAGNIIKIINAKGDSISYTYDAMNHKTSCTDANGNITRYSYDEYGNMVSVEDASGRVIKYEYDAAGNNTKVIYPNGTSVQYIYDMSGNMIKAVYPEDTEYHYDYDSVSNLIKLTYPDGTEESFEYDNNNNLIGAVDKKGNKIIYSIDTINETTGKITDSYGNIISYGFDENGRVNDITKSQGEKQDYIYNEAGNITSITDKAGNVTTYDYNEWGELLSETDPNGNRTEYRYDDVGNCIEKALPTGLDISYTYDDNYNVTKVETEVQGRRIYESYTYDAMGNILTYTDTMGRVTNYTYDCLNRIESEKGADDILIEYGYDNMGNLNKVSCSDGTNITLEYDNLGRNTSISQNGKTGGKSRVYKYSYDKMNRLVSTIDPMGNETSNTYDELGNVLTVTDAMDGVTKAEYDKTGRLLAEENSIGGKKTYSYDEGGRLLTETNARQQVTTYEYDALNRIIAVNDETGKTEYTYDKFGNTLTISNEEGVITREYDSLSRVTKITDCKGRSLSYTYDELGNILSITYPGGEIVRYEYNPDGTLCSVTDGSENKTNYEYDNAGRLKRTVKPDGSVEELTYDNAGNNTSKTEVTSEGEVLLSYEYTYDDFGNIISVKDNKMLDETISYVEEAGLLGVQKKETDSAATISTNMEYDADNRLISYNGYEILYDADGNMTYGPLDGKMVSFEYDCRNRLIKAGDTNYTYDAENIRISAETEEYIEEYVADRNHELTRTVQVIRYNKNIDNNDVENKKNDTSEIMSYYYGLSMIYGTTENEIEVYHFDHLGSTKIITDETGNILYRFSYGTYGEILSICDANIRFLYNGALGVMTDANGLCYMRQRYYNTDIKRFINRDVLFGNIKNSQSLNRYAYVQGNPVNYNDPFGLSPRQILRPYTMVAHDILNIATIVPGPVGAVAGLANAVIYMIEGDCQNACKAAIQAGLTGLMGPISSLAIGGVCNLSNTAKIITAISLMGAGVYTAGTSAYDFYKNFTSLVKEFSNDTTNVYNILHYISGIFTSVAGIVYGVSSVANGTKILNSQCFVAGTTVKTADGDKNIETIKAGDKVYSTDPETGETGIKSVKQVFVNETDELVHVEIKQISKEETDISEENNQKSKKTEIITTKRHPFYVAGYGFKYASELKIGDRVVSLDGNIYEITDVNLEKLSSPVKVYNFEVEDWHTYYVSSEGILVHNVCPTNQNQQNNNETSSKPETTGESVDVTVGEGGSDFGNYQFKEGVDIDLRGKGTYKDALDIAFEKTGIPKEDFTVTKWGKDKYGKSFPVEWKAKNGYEVNIDIGHSPSGNAPTVPHIGWQTAGKRGSGGGTRGHIFVDDVPYNR